MSNLSATVEEVASTTDQVKYLGVKPRGTRPAQPVDEASGRTESVAEDGQAAAEDAAEVMNGIGEVSQATEDQASGAEEIASMGDEVSGQANRVAEEIEDLAAANEEQAAMVNEVETSVSPLSGEKSEPDGGSVIDGHTGSGDVSIPEDLPDEIPDSVVAMLSEEELRDVALGPADPKDLT